VMERGKARGRVSVRRMQMKLLEAGNATMGVWLGKNILGQVDTVTVSGDAPLAYILMPAPPRFVDADEPKSDGTVTIDVGCSSNGSTGRMLEAGEPTESSSLVTQVDGELKWRTR
jgi:hypothetical protein